MEPSNHIHQQGTGNIAIQNVQGCTIIIHQHTGKKWEIPPTLKHLTQFSGVTPGKVFGRENDLRDLETAIASTSRVTLVKAEGGIGKTTLARLYAHTQQDRYSYILWVTYQTDLATSFGNDAIIQSILQELSSDPKEATALLPSLLFSLRGLPGKTLLVIDNATQEIADDPLLPLLSGNSNLHILATSRQDVRGFEKVTLEALQPADARRFFLSIYPNAEHDPHLDELLAYVGYNALGVEITAKTLKKHRGERDAGYLLEVFRSHSLGDLKKRIETEHSVGDATLLEILLKAFDVSGLGDYHQWILKQFYLLPPEDLGISTLKTLLGINNESEETFEDALDYLVETGWLRENEKGEVTIHRLVQEVISYKPGVEWADAERLCGNVTELVAVDQTKDNPATKFQWIPFAEYFLSRAGDWEEEGLNGLRNVLGLLFRNQGKAERAALHLEKALSSGLNLLGEGHAKIATRRSNLALIYKDLGRLPEAAALMEQALESDLKTFGEEHPSVAKRHSNLALIYQDLGRLPEAASLTEQALVAALKTFEEDHPQVAISRSNLATIYQALGRLPKAAALMEQALESELKTFGEGHPTIATSYNNLAHILWEQGQHQEAITLWEKAVAIATKTLGEKHPNTTTIKETLANHRAKLNP